MTPFAKPCAHTPYPGMSAQAVRAALADTGLACTTCFAHNALISHEVPLCQASF